MNRLELADLSGELVRAKASLLYADRVVVNSFRTTLLLVEALLGMRTIGQTIASPGARATQRQATELRRLADEFGSDEDAEMRKFADRLAAGDLTALADAAEYVASLARATSVGPPPMFVVVQAVDAFVGATDQPAARRARLAIRELEQLLEADVLDLTVADVEPLLTSSIDDIKDAAQHVIAHMVRDLMSSWSLSQFVIDSGTQLALQPVGRKPSETESRHASQAAIAAHLISQVPSLATLPVDELLDIRNRVAPQRARFRAAVAELEAAISTDITDDQFQDALLEMTRLRVEPELEALRETLREERVLPTLARSAPLTASGVIGLAASAAVGGPLLAGVAAVAAGLSGAVAKEYLGRQEREADRRSHRLFLLFDLERALGKRR